MKRVITVLVALCLALPAFAGERPAFYQGVRPLGMGGAFTAVADDGNAIFYNPAGLDKVQNWGIGVPTIQAEVNKKGMDFYKDAKKDKLWDSPKTEDVIDIIRKYDGDYLHVRAAALFPNFYMRHFGLAALAQANANVQPNARVIPPEANVDAFVTGSGHAGIGWGFMDGMIRVGAAGKYVSAGRLRQQYTAADIADPDFKKRVKDDTKKGSGFGIDAGAMLELPVLLKPTLGLTAQNIGGIKLGDAGKIPQQINVGVSLSHSFSILTLTGAADYLDVANNVKATDPTTMNEVKETDRYKHIHAGLEAKLWNLLALRGGLYQGYSTYGAGLDLWILKLDYASYAEEIGAYAGARPDRRHVVQVSLGW